MHDPQSDPGSVLSNRVEEELDRAAVVADDEVGIAVVVDVGAVDGLDVPCALTYRLLPPSSKLPAANASNPRCTQDASFM